MRIYVGNLAYDVPKMNWRIRYFRKVDSIAIPSTIKRRPKALLL